MTEQSNELKSKTNKNSPTIRTKQPSELLNAGTKVGIITLLSRVLGLIRDVLIAQTFGASANADAFFVAFKVPNFLRRLFGEGAFAQAFVPVLCEYKSKQPHQHVQQLVNHVFGLLGGATLVLSIAAILCAPFLVWLFAPGFSQVDAKMQIATEMLRITFPYLFFIALVAAASSILNTYQIFAPGAFAPILLNLCLIFAAAFVANHLQQPIMALAGAVLVAGILQSLFMLPWLKRIDLLPKPSLDTQHPGVKQILTLMAPAMLGVSVSQINLLLDTVLASFLISGSVSWLYYSDRLIELPLGIFGIAIATVILPRLSNQFAKGNNLEFNHTLDWGIKLVLLMALPAAAALMLMAEPILITLFSYGAFSATDVTATSSSLRAYAAGLLPIMLIKVLAPGFYAQQNMKTPVRIAVIAMLANMLFNLLLVWPLAHAGLALATSLSALLNAVLLYRYLIKDQIYTNTGPWLSYFTKICTSTLLMIVTLALLLPDANTWFSFTLLQRLANLTLFVGFGALVYFTLLYLFGLRLAAFKEPSAQKTP